jgi:hypothetical protein
MLLRAITHDSRVGLYVLNRLSGEMIELTSSPQTTNVAYSDFGFHNGGVRAVQWEPQKKSVMQVQYDFKSGQTILREIPCPADRLEHCSISNDGRHLYYTAVSVTEPGREMWRFARRDLSTGDELEVFRSTNRFELRTGPRGTLAEKLPLVIVSSKPHGGSTVSVIEVAEHTAKARFSVDIPVHTSRVVWGWWGRKSHLVFTRTDGISTIAAENGEVRRTELWWPPLNGSAPNTRVLDQNQVFFEKGADPVNDLWVMENFLPRVATAK